jgi:Flp pilus assembly protein protease CpaA
MLNQSTLQMMILLLGIGIFTFVAYGDIRTRRIPNEFIVGPALAAFGWRSPEPGSALCTLVGERRALSTFRAFARLGGGDVGLIRAAARRLSQL